MTTIANYTRAGRARLSADAILLDRWLRGTDGREMFEVLERVPLRQPYSQAVRN